MFKLSANVSLLTTAVLAVAIVGVSVSVGPAAEPVKQGGVEPPQTGNVPAATAAGGNLVLDRNSYFRAWTEFGFMRLSGQALKTESEKLLGRGLSRIEQSSKKLLANRNYDWTSTDWRDLAVFYMFTGQAGDDTSAMTMLQSIAPPANWTKPDFDDSAFDRLRPGTPIQVLGGDDFREVSSLLRRGLYYRTYFDVPDPSAAEGLTAKLIYRGGARIFVNGEEIVRASLPDGAVTQETFGSDYPAEAYIALPAELPEKVYTDIIGDLRCAFDDARPPEDSRDPKFKSAYGNAVIDRAGWDRLMKLRDREIGPVAVPSRLLRQGRNTLAVEIRTAKYHPILIGGAREAQQKDPRLQDSCRRGWGGGMGRNPRWDHAALVNVELRAKSAAVPTCLKRPAGAQAWVDDMNKWLVDRDYNPAGFPVGTARFVGGQNGTYSTQLGFGTDRSLAALHAVCGELAGEGGAKIPASAISVQYGVGHSLNEMGALGYSRCAPNEIGYFCPVASLLLWRYSDGRNQYGRELPKDGEAARKIMDEYVRGFRFFDHLSPDAPKSIPANSCQPIWLTLKVPENAAAGKYKGSVTIQAEGAASLSVPVEAEVIDWRVPAPQEFQTFVQSEQTPYGILKAYKGIEPWSERHWQLIESSFRQLARIGNDWVYVPVLMNTEIGNQQDTMVKWVRKKDGSLAFDYTLMDKYLELAAKTQGRPKAVCFLVMQAAASPSNAVKILDEASGQTETLELGPAQDATRRPYWRAFAASALAHMRQLGLEEAMYFGQAFDDVPDRGLAAVLAEVAPNVGWTCAGHQRAPDATYRLAARAYGVDVLDHSQQGWKNPYVHLLMPRTGGSVICVEGISTPFSWRVMCDRAIYCGFNGVGRAGADYFDRTWFDGFKGGYWCMVGRGSVMTLWPGANGVDSGARNEAMLEGIQESELRIFLEQAIDRKVLPDDLAKETQAALDDHFRATLHIATGVRDNQTMDLAQDWQNRSRRLYQAAAKVASRIGLDVDKTEFGGAKITLKSYEGNQTVTGTKVEIPALGVARLALRLRDWSNKPRQWKAASAEPWIVPQQPSGSVNGHQSLEVTLDGATLKSGADAVGTLTITDVAAGTAYPVKINAVVGKPIEYQLHQEFQFITGGGAGAEMPKLIKVVKDPVFNVPAGGSEAQEYFLVSRAKDKQPWKIESSAAWLATEPAYGEIAANTSVPVKIVAKPADKAAAAYDVTLTLTAANGAVKESYPVKVFVVPPYQAPPVPAGETVWLSDLDAKKFVKRNVDAGFSKQKSWNNSGEEPRLFHTRFGKLPEENPPADMKREEYATAPYTMAKKTFTHGLWVSPSHETTYNIEGAGFSAFSAEVGFYDGLVKNGYNNIGTVVYFEIYVDGKLRAQSGPVKFGDAPRLLAVTDLRDAKEVKLATRRDDLISEWYTRVTWGDPRFHK